MCQVQCSLKLLLILALSIRCYVLSKNVCTGKWISRDLRLKVSFLLSVVCNRSEVAVVSIARSVTSERLALLFMKSSWQQMVQMSRLCFLCLIGSETDPISLVTLLQGSQLS